MPIGKLLVGVSDLQQAGFVKTRRQELHAYGQIERIKPGWD